MLEVLRLKSTCVERTGNKLLSGSPPHTSDREGGKRVSEFFEGLAGFVSGLSARGWVTLVALVVLAGVVFFGVRAYSGGFTYDRIEREIDLLSELQEIRRDTVMRRDTGLVRVYQGIRTKLDSTVRRDRGLSLPTISVGPRFWQLVVAFIPWILLALAFWRIEAFHPKEGDLVSAVTGTLFVGFLFALVGSLLFPDWPAWVRYLLYPIGGTILIMIVLAKKGGS